MMNIFNNDKITLYNRVNEFYYRTELDNVDWQSKDAIVAENNGIAKTNEITIFIDKPLSGYLKPKEYIKQDSKKMYFTFKPGDLIVKGWIDFVIDQPQAIKRLHMDFDDVVTITAVRELEEHFEIICE